jgi:hypothetical protein
VDHQLGPNILAQSSNPGGRRPAWAIWSATAVLLLAGCPSGDPAAPPELPAVGGQVSVIRVPFEGGIVEAYDADDLRRPIWTSRVPIPPLSDILGVNLEAGLLVAVDALKNLVVVDLESRGIRLQSGGVEQATMAPDGSVYSVGSNRRVTRIDAAAL